MSIQPAITELERAFEVFCPLFEGITGPPPVIVIQTKGRRRVSGWFCGGKWKQDETILSEITLAAEDLAAPVEDIAMILLHEMVHFANHVRGINDCSRAQYHNRHFKRQAEAVGLIVKAGSRGFAYTTLGQDLRHKVLRADLRQDAFTLFRQPSEQAKQPTKMLKWSCACTNIRAATEVNALCQACGKTFARS